MAGSNTTGLVVPGFPFARPVARPGLFALLVIFAGWFANQDLAAERLLEELGLVDARGALDALHGERDLAGRRDDDLDVLLAHDYSAAHFRTTSWIEPSSWLTSSSTE